MHQPNLIEGHLSGDGHRYAIVVARFNSFITEQLLKGCMDGLVRSGVKAENISAVWVPGAWEIPMAARTVANTGGVDGVICLGAVIRGSTPHFDYVSNEVAKGVAEIPRQTGVPAVFGVITTDSIEQAIERAGTKMGNKGFEAARSAVEMVNLLKEIDVRLSPVEAR